MFSYPTKTTYDESEKVWRGTRINSVFNPNVSLGQTALQILNLNPEKIVQISVSTGEQLTAGELRVLAIRAAQHFANFGLTQNDVMGMIASNSHFLAPLAFGALLYGIPFNPLDPSFDKGEIKHMFGATKPKIVFCDASCYQKTKQALEELESSTPIYLLTGYLPGVPTVEKFFKPTGNEDLFIPPFLNNGRNHTAVIICSSGTTGLPKGVCMSHHALLAHTESLLTSNEVLLSFSTLYWYSGMFILLLGTLCCGTRIVTDQQFTPELLLEIIEKYRVTFLFGPPSQTALAIQCPDIETRDLSSLKTYICTGSAVPVAIAKKMQGYLKNGDLIVVYGMSEIAGAAAKCSKRYNRSGSVGQVEINMEIKIIDDEGLSLGVGERGEICIKCPYKSLGYYGNIESPTDNAGWTHSGDIGHFDEDGYLYVVDRKKEILKYKNFHYSPTEIETMIIQMPGVVEVCVFGMPDIVATDLPAAAIVKNEDVNISEEDVYNCVAANMVHFKHLRGGVHFVTSLPKTASGKILRRKVKEMFSSNADPYKIDK